MCDENTIADDEAMLAAQSKVAGASEISRRKFAAVSGGAARGCGSLAAWIHLCRGYIRC